VGVGLSLRSAIESTRQPSPRKALSSSPCRKNRIAWARRLDYRLGTAARAFTRNRLDWSDYYRPIVEATAKLRCRSAVIDGEVVALDEEGRSDFHAIQAAIGLGGRGLVFIAFDLMFLDGRDLRCLSIEERRAELRHLIPRSPKSRPQFSEEIAGEGAAVFASAGRLGLEGIVSKASYRSVSGLTTGAGGSRAGARPSAGRKPT
jgi:ATP-dependent DNA ligase